MQIVVLILKYNTFGQHALRKIAIIEAMRYASSAIL